MELMRESSTYQKPPKKVLQILDSFDPKAANVATTLFLGDLSVICDEIKLYELFSRFGAVESVQMKKSDRDPQRAHLGFGFIKFASHDSAERALQEMNGYFFLGRAMRVAWAADIGKKGFKSLEKSLSPKSKPTAQIHVMFVTRELNRRVSEMDLGAVFSRYGNLIDIAIKKNATNSTYGVQSGYAFLHFTLTPEGLKSAITAVEEVNNLVVDNIAYQCKVTHTLQAQFLPMKCFEEELERIGQSNFPSVATLPDSSFKTYESSSHPMNHLRSFEMDSLPQQHVPPLNRHSSVSKYYGKSFNSPEQSFSLEPSSLHHHLTPSATEMNQYLPSSKKMSDDRIMNSFTRQESSSPQQYFHPAHDHYHNHNHLAAESSSLTSLSSSFDTSVNEDSLRKRNNNGNVIKPSDIYY